MLDQLEIVKLVETEIAKKVELEMQSLLEDDAWKTVVEQAVVKYAQDRVNAKFNSSEWAPQLIDAVERSVERMFETGKVKEFSSIVDDKKLINSINSKISEIVTKTSEEQIERKFSDHAFLDKIQSVVNQHVSSKLDRFVGTVDVTDKINNRIDQIFDTRLSAIDRKTTQVQLTLMEGTVVNEHEFVTKSLNVMEDAVVNNLIVKGRVNTDNRSWSELSEAIEKKTIKAVESELTSTITESVLSTVTEKGVDVNKIHSNGVVLISNTELGNTIIHSNLERVGALQELSVIGATSLNETVTVSRGKLGINTESPNMALDVWDGEVQITLGKKKQDTGYIGLGRKGTLEIGSSTTAIIIDDEGKTKINELMIGRNNISWGNEIPGYSGQKGDIVFNMNPTSSNSVGWQCLGKFKWRVFD
jgi:hypothetical protein